uniref:Ig-like domain-containing protein n=1 Tax=Gasterosteus aculeatus aculeatus TaxID=481459 RepID=A0AAQ4QN52_GASAC
MAVRVGGVLVVVHQGEEEAGEEAGQRQQHRQHRQAGEGEPEEGPIQSAMRPREHPGPAEPQGPPSLRVPLGHSTVAEPKAEKEEKKLHRVVKAHRLQKGRDGVYLVPHRPGLYEGFQLVCVFVAVSGFKVAEGGVASLSCQYSVKRFGLSRVCWGRGCGTFWCNNILVQTDEHGVVSKVADRYRLAGDVLDGQMDLDILSVRRTDSGPYCCRVDVDGIFNDKKVIMNLRVVKAPVASSPPRAPATSPTATGDLTQPSASTVNWKTLLSSQLDLLGRNSTMLRSDTVTVDDSSLSLHINVPVLSLSVSLLFVLAVGFLFLAFKRGVYRRAVTNSCLSSEEPAHIIYEIRMRRPVQENIYSLD